MLKLKPWMVNLLLIFSGIATGVGIIETIAIFTGFLVPRDFADRHRWFYEFMEPDDRLGYKPKPNLRNFKLSWMEESVSEVVNTDKYGFRNPPRDYAATDLYFVGDSFTWGAWVNREETFYGIIESKLKRPVITLGVGGYGIQQYEIIFQEFITKYKPKATVLGIYANDLAPLTPTFKNYYHNLGWTKYKYMPWHKKTLSYQILFQNQRRREILERQSYRKEDKKKASNGITLYEYRGASETYLNDAVYNQVENIFSRIIKISKKNNVKLIVIIFPTKESTYIDDYNRLFPDNSNYLKNEDIGYQRLCQLAKAKDVTCLNLTNIFRQRGKGKKLYFDLDPHWNAVGHQLVAEEVLETLEREVDFSHPSTKYKSRNHSRYENRRFVGRK